MSLPLADVEYTATSAPWLEPTSDPEPAGVAPLGTGNPLGQPGGSWPESDSETCPESVVSWKFFGVVVELCVVVVALLPVLLFELLEHAAADRTSASTAASVRKGRVRMVSSSFAALASRPRSGPGLITPGR